MHLHLGVLLGKNKICLESACMHFQLGVLLGWVGFVTDCMRRGKICLPACLINTFGIGVGLSWVEVERIYQTRFVGTLLYQQTEVSMYIIRCMYVQLSLSLHIQ